MKYLWSFEVLLLFLIRMGLNVGGCLKEEEWGAIYRGT
jgi:hypothetical protein